RVTRVEPSLQAAFIEYGGNRHGFLAFGEIHPDYYQIPVADREILRKAEALEIELAQKLAELNSDDDDADAIDPDEDELGGRGSDDRGHDESEAAAEAAGEEQPDDDETPADYAPGSEGEDGGDWHAADEGLIEAVGASEKASPEAEDDSSDDAIKRGASSDEEEEEEEEERNDEDDTSSSSAAMEANAGKAVRSTEEDAVADEVDAETPDGAYATAGDEAQAVGDEDASASSEDEIGDAEARADDEESETEKAEPTEEELAARARQKEINQLRSRYEEAKRERNRLIRAYKIQEVIKRRQIMLVQVVKEERGNKGAALTTYLSLAGRYGVLMPNTARGGGISRKITSQSDRKRLKKAMSGLDIPQNMGLIIRTAGAKRTKVEIKRDY
ncbi:MAG: ribonuclease E/G, partial [Planctomycetota bacterium]